MSEAILLALALLAGMLLGAIFFGGLWWTVRKGLASTRPAQWFIASLLLRIAITLCGFYFVAGADWRRLAACLLGFIIARAVATRLSGMAAEGVSHAP